MRIHDLHNQCHLAAILWATNKAGKQVPVSLEIFHSSKALFEGGKGLFISQAGLV